VVSSTSSSVTRFSYQNIASICHSESSEDTWATAYLSTNQFYRGSKQVRNGNYSQREFFIVLPALLFSAQSAGQLFSLAPEVARAKAAAQSVFSLHDEKPTIMTESPTSTTVAVSNGDALLAGSSASYGTFGVRGELEFRNVSLHYPSRPNVPALNDVSFQIRQGENVAFVGRSGKMNQKPARRPLNYAQVLESQVQSI